MPKRQQLLYSLARRKVRSSFNKFNLYNAMKWKAGPRRGTIYQQKFSAKQETRAYHGEKLTETQWRNVFAGELNGVNPLKSTKTAEGEGPAPETPWALQTFLPIERRLDTAVFRAFFASSPRQAAQFIVKGKVRVNGIKIKSPGYELKAGDMFSVDPESVLMAMGREKPSVKEAVKLTNRQIQRYNKYLRNCKKYPRKMWRLRQHNRARHAIHYKRHQEKLRQRVAEQNKSLHEQMSKEIDSVTPQLVFSTILDSEPFFTQHGTLPLPRGEMLNKSLSVYEMATGQAPSNKAAAVKGATKHQIKKFTSTALPSTSEKVEAYFGKTDNSPGNKGDVKGLLRELVQLKQAEIRNSYNSQLKGAGKLKEKYEKKWVEQLPDQVEKIDESAVESAESAPTVKLPFSDGKLYGLSDPSKQYFTPWTPRPFIAPFAVLPHHIEISFKTCHAVYLRDPVARPGHSEIISPLPLDMHERAYMFYVRKRRKGIARRS